MNVMKKTPFLLYTILFLVMSSCVSPQYVTNITTHGKLENLDEKTVTIVGLDRIFIHDFQKTFNKNFKNNIDFSLQFSVALAASLYENNVFSEATAEVSQDWNHMQTIASKKSYLKVEALLNECKTDYIIFVDEFDIRQNVKIEKNNVSNTNMNSTSSTELIELKASVTVLNVKTHEPVIEFTIFAEDEIFFFAYSKSMIDVRTKLIKSMVSYLGTFN